MSSFNWSPIQSSGGTVPTYANLAAFPSASSAGNGALAIALDTDILYISNGTVWTAIGGPGSVLSLAPFGSAPNSSGGTLSANVLTLEPADGSNPGGVSTTTQSFAGNKTFTGTIAASNLSGTNTGDVTLGTANGLSLLGQALSLGLSSTSTTGALSNTDWNTFNSKQPAGSYISSLTGDVTASGPGAAAATVAKIQGTTVSGTTGTTNVVFSSAPTMSNPVVGTQTQGDSSTKAASTAYVDVAVANALAGINPAIAVQAATTAAGDTSGLTYNNGVSGVGATFTGSTNTAITIDGFTFTTVGQRLLVKNDTQSPSGAFNGIYSFTQLQTGLLPPIFTRALDYDTPSNMNNTGVIPVINGTANSTTTWVLTSLVVSVGVTPLTFTKFSANPSSYLLSSNNLSDVANATTSFNNISGLTALGDTLYGGAAGTRTRLPGNTVATKNFLTQTGAGGGVSAAPVWATIAPADISNLTNTNLSGSAAISNANLNTMPSHTVKANNTGGVATPTDVAFASAATASTFMIRDSSANVQTNNFIPNFTTTATAAGTTTLDVASTYFQQFTGTTTQQVNLPDTSTLVTGQAYMIMNRSTGIVTVKTTSGTNLVQSMAAGSQLIVTVTNVGNNNAASWDAAYSLATAATSAQAWNVTSQTTTYAAVINDYVICSSASFVVTLPTAVGQTGKQIAIKHNDTSLSNAYTLNTTSSQTINGAGGTVASGAYILYTNGEILILTSDGANWQVSEHQTASLATSWTPMFATKFTVTAANATAGATYTNNGQTFVVVATIAGATTLQTVGTGNPAASGNLTKATGTGDSTIAFSTSANSNGTVTSVNAWWMRYGNRMKAWGSFLPGTATANLWIMSLPGAAATPVALDTTFLAPSANTTANPGMKVGVLQGSGAASALYNLVTAPGTNASVLFDANVLSGTTTLTPQTGQTGITSGALVSWDFDIAISGWQP